MVAVGRATHRKSRGDSACFAHVAELAPRTRREVDDASAKRVLLNFNLHDRILLTVAFQQRIPFSFGTSAEFLFLRLCSISSTSHLVVVPSEPNQHDRRLFVFVRLYCLLESSS